MKSTKKLLDFALRGLWFPMVLFGLIAVLTILDIWADLAAGTTVFHVVVESLLVLVAMAGALYFWKRFVVAKRAERELKQALSEARAESDRWHEEEEQLLHNLNAAIDRRFTKWDFSPTEKDIAFHLLKGLSMKEIAKLRGSTPRSITQQAYVLYHKAGLGGRAELSAYFLGGLVQPEGASGDSPPGKQKT